MIKIHNQNGQNSQASLLSSEDSAQAMMDAIRNQFAKWTKHVNGYTVHHVVFDWDMNIHVEDSILGYRFRCKAQDYVLNKKVKLPKSFDWYTTPHIVYDEVHNPSGHIEYIIKSLHLVNPIDACHILGMDYDKYIKEYENSE